jgi:hypothetical protein
MNFPKLVYICPQIVKIHFKMVYSRFKCLLATRISKHLINEKKEKYGITAIRRE